MRSKGVATEKYYSIHDIVTFKIVNKSRFFAWQFNSIHRQYQSFECQKINNPDFNVYLGEFTPSNQGCYIIGDKYYVREDYFYCDGDSYKLARWRFEMSGFESGNATVRIASNLTGFMFMSGFIIDFLVHFKLNEKGYPVVHGSCVSKNGHGYLFLSRSGGGKTTMALSLVEKGYDFLGDNFAILHDGYGLSFPSPLNIFSYNLTPMVKRSLGIKNRVVLHLKALLYKMTSGYLKIFTKVEAKDIFPGQVVDKAKIDVAFLLLPKGKTHIENLSVERLIEHLVKNQQLDTVAFLGYLAEYSYIFPASNLATHWERYKRNLKGALGENIPGYKVEVPQQYDSAVIEQILEVLHHDAHVEL